MSEIVGNESLENPETTAVPPTSPATRRGIVVPRVFLSIAGAIIVVALLTLVLVKRVFASIVVAVIATGVMSVCGYFLMASIDNSVLEIVLMTVMYIVGSILGIALRMTVRMTLIDLLLFLLFSLTFTIIGFQYVSNAVSLL